MIICAALLVQVEGLDHVTIVPCHRHGDGYQILKDFGCGSKEKHKVLSEGFITHDGVYLNRIEAWEHARVCGQLPRTVEWYKDDHADSELYSEDLY